MKITDILGLFGGLSLFLYGMKMMSDGLESAAGSKMQGILEKLTSNRFLGVLVGALITAIIQSSSATTVMVVGFVNSGLMSLLQSVWIIMGANIGTTITGQLIALDIGTIAPVFAFFGVVCMMFIKKRKINNIGQIIGGLGILFIGMGLMSSAMKPLRTVPEFVELLTHFNNPLLGVLVGALFTALIQSSSASIGILQTLAMSGTIALGSSVYILFGMNIGTCITAAIACVGTSRNAKRATLVHILFNVLGTVVFLVLIRVTPFIGWIEQNVISPSAQIANVHTVFNVVTTLLLLPFGAGLAKLSQLILPAKDDENAGGLKFIPVKALWADHQIGASAIVRAQVRNELGHMLELTTQNVEMSFNAVLTGNMDEWETIESNEDTVDFLNKEIVQYISHVMAGQLDEKDSLALNAYYSITGNIERIADHAINLAGYAKYLKNGGTTFSAVAQGEIERMKTISLRAMAQLKDGETQNKVALLLAISQTEQLIDDTTDHFRENQIDRMRKGSCRPEAGVLFTEMLTDFERMGDHALNIAEEYQRVNA